MKEEVLVLEELTKANNDLKWFTQNYTKIQKDCSNKFVAIKDEKVMFCATELEKLINELTEHKKNPTNFLVDFVYGKGESLVV